MRYTVDTTTQEDEMLDYLSRRTDQEAEQILENVIAMMLQAWENSGQYKN